jgi:hypothetical protein
MFKLRDRVLVKNKNAYSNSVATIASLAAILILFSVVSYSINNTQLSNEYSKSGISNKKYALGECLTNIVAEENDFNVFNMNNGQSISSVDVANQRGSSSYKQMPSSIADIAGNVAGAYAPWETDNWDLWEDAINVTWNSSTGIYHFVYDCGGGPMSSINIDSKPIDGSNDESSSFNDFSQSISNNFFTNPGELISEKGASLSFSFDTELLESLNTNYEKTKENLGLEYELYITATDLDNGEVTNYGKAINQQSNYISSYSRVINGEKLIIYLH